MPPDTPPASTPGVGLGSLATVEDLHAVCQDLARQLVDALKLIGLIKERLYEAGVDYGRLISPKGTRH